MNLGMIGAIGGAGQAGINQAAILGEEEKADKALGREKNLQTFLMKARDEYAIKSEDRATTREIDKEARTDTRGEEQKDRDFTRTQAEAPTRRGIKSEDTKADVVAKSDAGFQTADQDATTAGKLAEGKETQADKDVKGATAELYRDRGNAARNAPASKMDAVDKDELDALQGEIKTTAGNIEKAKLDGTWTGTPDQKRIEAELVGKRLKAAAITNRARAGRGGDGGGAPAADPLGLRGSGKKTTGMISSRGAEPQAQAGVSATEGANLNDPALASAIDDIKDPQERANARAALSRPAGQPSPAVPQPAPRPAAAAAPVAAVPAAASATKPADPVTDLLDAFKRTPEQDATMASEEQQMAFGDRLNYTPATKDYVGKIRALRDRMAAQQRASAGQAAASRSRELLVR
jgi:hypothetical protein